MYIYILYIYILYIYIYKTYILEYLKNEKYYELIQSF